MSVLHMRLSAVGVVVVYVDPAAPTGNAPDIGPEFRTPRRGRVVLHLRLTELRLSCSCILEPPQGFVSGIEGILWPACCVW